MHQELDMDMDIGDHGKEVMLSLKDHLVCKDLPDGTRLVTHKNVSNRTLQGLKDLRQYPGFCDVKFEVEGKELLAHRCVLVLHSSYFHAMFADGFKEGSSMNTVISPAPEIVDLTSAEALLDFMYTGRLTVTVETVQGLLIAAEHWQMAEVKQRCEEFMGLNINDANCLEILGFAEMYHCPALIAACHDVIKLQFSVVCQTPMFPKIPTHTLAQILEFDELNLSTNKNEEDEVLEALFTWLEFDSQNRLADLPELLKKVRLAHTSEGCRKKLLEEHPLTKDNAEIKQITMDLLEEKKHARFTIRSLFVIGGFTEGSTKTKPQRVTSTERCEMFARWSFCAKFPMEEPSDIVAFKVHGRVFAVAYQPVLQRGNRRVVATEAGIFEYRPIQDEWLDAKPNFSPHALQSLDTCLQAEGAITVCPDTNTIFAVSHAQICSIAVDMLDDGDISGSQVITLPPFPANTFAARQRSFCAVVLHRKLYVLGGDKREENSRVPTASSLVLMYDPDKNLWESKTPMRHPRFKAAAAVLNGKIYVCGGVNNERLRSMEFYNPAKDTWTLGPSMKYTRSHHQLLTRYTTLVAIGGKSYYNEHGDVQTVVRNMELFWSLSKSWDTGAWMNTGRYGFAAVCF